MFQRVLSTLSTVKLRSSRKRLASAFLFPVILGILRLILIPRGGTRPSLRMTQVEICSDPGSDVHLFNALKPKIPF
jgi:hypothetical protein